MNSVEQHPSLTLSFVTSIWALKQLRTYQHAIANQLANLLSGEASYMWQGHAPVIMGRRGGGEAKGGGNSLTRKRGEGGNIRQAISLLRGKTDGRCFPRRIISIFCVPRRARFGAPCNNTGWTVQWTGRDMMNSTKDDGISIASASLSVS
jgi:hypothetical protein